MARTIKCNSLLRNMLFCVYKNTINLFPSKNGYKLRKKGFTWILITDEGENDSEFNARGTVKD